MFFSLQEIIDYFLYGVWYGTDGIVVAVMLTVVLGGLMVSMVGLTLLWLRVLLYGFGTGMPKCGRCGYIVRGIGSLGCPECGADLREAGIVTGRQRYRVPPLAFVMWWSVLLLPSAAIFSVVLILVGPKQSYTGEYLSATMPTVNAQLQFSNEAGESPSDVPPPAVHLNVWINQNNATNATGYAQSLGFDVDTVNMTYMSYGAPMAQPSALDRDAVLAWWQPWGVDLADPDVIAEADELLRLLREAPQQGLQGLSSQVFTQLRADQWMNEQPAVWFFWLQLPLWFVVWLAGVVIYALLQPRSQRRESASMLLPTKPVPPTSPNP